jgi:integrase
LATIRLRGDKYHAQVRRDGQQNTKSFALKRDAEAWARKMEVQVDRNELPEDQSILKSLTLADLVIRYRDTISPMKKNKKWEEIVLNAFLRHLICKKRLSQLTSSDFARYRDERLKYVKPRSIQREFSPLHNLFEIARDEWGIPLKENPLDKVRIRCVDNRRQRRLKDGELERILFQAGKRENPYVVPIILFAIETALRRGEMLSLTWETLIGKDAWCSSQSPRMATPEQSL